VSTSQCGSGKSCADGDRPAIRFLNVEQVQEIATNPDIPHASFLAALAQCGTPSLIRNVRTSLELVEVERHVFPVTVNETEYENSWVCSPFNAVISYPLDELREIRSRLLRFTLRGLIHSMAPMLRAAQINRVVCINNWLLSTNLYPDWNGEGLNELTSECQRRWPDHAIMFRSLNRMCHDRLMNRLIDCGYLLAPSRQVYLCEDLHAAQRKQNSEIDHALLIRRTKYRVVRDDDLTDDDVPRIRELYDQLYLGKYSRHNPQFTDELIRLWGAHQVLRLIGLRSPLGSLDGIVGCLVIDRVLTTPLIGYDLALPRRLGLYRLLTALVFEEARNNECLLNLSAGAAAFKRHRGGRPHLEYSAVFVRHLPIHRRLAWSTLSLLLTHIGATVLQRLEL
jgi:hypothetical protein